MGKIFISHSSANNAEALAIHDWLSEQGWGDVFLDLDPKRGLVAGDRWQAALKAAAEQCELILILIIVLLIFGSTKLAGLGKGLGEGIRNFRKGLKGEDGEPDDAKPERKK